jgi:ubiquinone/menaquinone biosynthesis C-methylase UbiE
MTISGPAVGGAPSATAPAPAPALQVPRYLDETYWWAYVHPKAVQVFEREWLVDTILFGNYGRLRDSALDEMGQQVRGRSLQLACVYGNLTVKLRRRLVPEATLDVLDILPVQLDNLRRKLPADERVTLLRGDSSALDMPDASYDQVLMFFLLHEQPASVRKATLAEAMRVVKPGGKVVVVDYHQPVRWHPVRPLMKLIFRRLEPFAMDLWHNEVADFMAPGAAKLVSKRTFFGGLYQKLVFTR